MFCTKLMNSIKKATFKNNVKDIYFISSSSCFNAIKLYSVWRNLCEQYSRND
jgi:hypothetical protein